jgi:hypothetical protein
MWFATGVVSSSSRTRRETEGHRRARLPPYGRDLRSVHAGRFRVAGDVFPIEPLDLGHRVRQLKEAVFSAHRAGAIPKPCWRSDEWWSTLSKLSSPETSPANAVRNPRIDRPSKEAEVTDG